MASAYAVPMPGSADGAAQFRSITSSSVVEGVSVRSSPRRRPPGRRVYVPDPWRAAANPLSTRPAYARVTVVRETPRATLRSRSLGSRRSTPTRPSPISSRSSSASPAYAGRRSKPAASAARRGAAMDPTMQSTLSQVAIYEESNLGDHGGRVHHSAAADRPQRPRPDRPAAGRPPRPSPGPAVRRPVAVRLLDRVDGALRPGAGSVGRAALRADEMVPIDIGVA